MVDRNYVLNLIKSKDVTIEEFNYDKLSAPPISFFFSPFDIKRLYEIATSLRYSAKPQVKYQEIDKIMKSRGFAKLAAGTNRVVYRCIDNDTFVAKIAYDSVGLTDNPREFMNQEYLKPFCAKTFEVAGDGVIAFSERLNPITNREEFLSVAESIYTLITEFIIGEYIMDDIGTKYFMNYGMRKGFGPCILDYSFLYKLDGNKLFCNKPDNNKPEGKCLGEIDYDAGYNHLVCKRCGKTYRAKELELKTKQNTIISKSFKGEFNKMKVRVSGGSKKYDVTTVVETTEVNTPKAAPAVEVAESAQDNIPKKKSIHVSLGGNGSIGKDTLSNSIIKPKMKDDSEVTTTSEEPIKAEVKSSPIKVGGEKKTDIELLRDAFSEAGKLIASKNINGSIDNTYVDDALKNVKFILDTLRSSNVWNNEFEKELFDIVVDNDHLKLNIEIFDGSTIQANANILAADDSTVVSYGCVKVNEAAKDEEYPEAEEVAPAEEMETTEVQINVDETSDNIEDVEYYDDSAAMEQVDDEDEVPISEYESFDAEIIDVATKLHNVQSKNVIVIHDTPNTFFTINHSILFTIDRINGMDVNDIAIISKKYLDTVLKEVEGRAVELTADTFKQSDEVSVNGVVTEG